MKGFVPGLLTCLAIFVVTIFASTASAGGFGVFGTRAAPLLFPRVQVAAQRQAFVAPFVVQRQAFVVPQVQTFVAPSVFVPSQAIVVPQVQAVVGGCGSLLIH